MGRSPPGSPHSSGDPLGYLSVATSHRSSSVNGPFVWHSLVPAAAAQPELVGVRGPPGTGTPQVLGAAPRGCRVRAGLPVPRVSAARLDLLALAGRARRASAVRPAGSSRVQGDRVKIELAALLGKTESSCLGGPAEPRGRTRGFFRGGTCRWDEADAAEKRHRPLSARQRRARASAGAPRRGLTEAGRKRRAP